MLTENDILKALRQIIDPARNQNIVDLGFVNNIDVKEGKVTFHVRPEYKASAEKAALAIEGVSVVKATVMAGPATAQGNPNPQNMLNGIKSIIAVSSCKGGVGKSTVAVNLAQELADRGFKTGLIDADIYGPSIPTLLNLTGESIYTNEKKQLIPIEKNNLKIVSFGFLLGGAPAVMRGPIVTRYIQQLFFATDWGELDYLIVDMPPGTGDIHLTITQSVCLTGAIIVTTPHTLSLVDVARGILMFEKVNVPILGIIENMAYYTDDNGKKQYIFGQSSAEKLKDSFGIDTLADIPILPALGAITEKPTTNTFIQNAADKTLKKLESMASGQIKIPQIKFDAETIRFQWDNGEEWTVDNLKLRSISKDALSIDEVTGRQKIKPEQIRKDLAANDVTPLGNYAIGVSWNDGHSAAIYPYADIKKIADIKQNA